MKESELIKEQAGQEENDLKYMGLMQKAIRAERSERFEDIWLSRLEQKTKVEKRPNGSYSFEMEGMGMVDYYPKANRLLIRRKNEWIKPALHFIIKKFRLYEKTGNELENN